MSTQKYMCCFCKKSIFSNQVDIVSIIVVTNFEKDKNFQQEQQLYCHLECLKNRLAKNVELYIGTLGS